METAGAVIPERQIDGHHAGPLLETHRIAAHDGHRAIRRVPLDALDILALEQADLTRQHVRLNGKRHLKRVIRRDFPIERELRDDVNVCGLGRIGIEPPALRLHTRPF